MPSRIRRHDPGPSPRRIVKAAHFKIQTRACSATYAGGCINYIQCDEAKIVPPFMRKKMQFSDEIEIGRLDKKKKDLS